jgi:hypothetical protein
LFSAPQIELQKQQPPVCREKLNAGLSLTLFPSPPQSAGLLSVMPVDDLLEAWVGEIGPHVTSIDAAAAATVRPKSDLMKKTGHSVST